MVDLEVGLDTCCYIAGAGEYSGHGLPMEGDFVIAADAGYARLLERGIVPDLIVGDFDSLNTMPEHPNILHSPAEKDDTDMMLAVKQGIKLGFKRFVIEGGMGGRFDHSLANLQTLVYIAQQGARGVLLGRDACITAVKNGSVGFLPGATGYISVFSAMGVAEGVTLTGLKYLLESATIRGDYPLGVSNEFSGVPATISVKNGTLIVTWTCGPEWLVVNSE